MRTLFYVLAILIIIGNVAGTVYTGIKMKESQAVQESFDTKVKTLNEELKKISGSTAEELRAFQLAIDTVDPLATTEASVVSDNGKNGYEIFPSFVHSVIRPLEQNLVPGIRIEGISISPGGTILLPVNGDSYEDVLVQYASLRDAKFAEVTPCVQTPPPAMNEKEEDQKVVETTPAREGADIKPETEIESSVAEEKSITPSPQEGAPVKEEGQESASETLGQSSNGAEKVEKELVEEIPCIPQTNFSPIYSSVDMNSIQSQETEILVKTGNSFEKQTTLVYKTAFVLRLNPQVLRKTVDLGFTPGELVFTKKDSSSWWDKVWNSVKSLFAEHFSFIKLPSFFTQGASDKSATEVKQSQ